MVRRDRSEDAPWLTSTAVQRRACRACRPRRGRPAGSPLRSAAWGAWRRRRPEGVAPGGSAAACRGGGELGLRTSRRRVPDEIATARAREEALEARITEREERVHPPPLVTEDRLLDALGEETAR